MKHLIYIILLNTFFSYSQSANEEKKIYSYAIDNYYNLLQKYFKAGITNASTLKDLYFVYKDIPSEYLPNEIENYKIKYIDLNDKENCKLITDKICTVYIRPIKIDGNRVILTLYLTTITYKNNKYYFANGDFKETVFTYSCDEKKWIAMPEEK